MPRMKNALAIIPKRLLPLAALLLAGAASLGSSPGFSLCSDTYNRPYDQSHEFSDRWSRGRGADSARWTPDGARILFSHAGRIYVVDADGMELTSLSGSYEPAHLYSPTAEIDFAPALSPDGSRVAYSTLRYAKGELLDHTYEIAVQPIDGSDRTRLTENDRDDIRPSWSPDGSLIAFLSPGADRGNYRIFAISPDGSGEREIAPSVSALCCVLMWSSDGGRLAFIGERRDAGPLEWVDTYDSSNHTRETTPDYVFRRQSIYTVKADGSDLVELAWSENPDSPPKTRFGSYELRAPEEAVSALQWSPDGERIAFAASRYGDKDGIYVAGADGASVQRIFDLATVSEFEKPLADGLIPGIAFRDEQIHGIAWSPDGSRIDFEASVVRGDAYALAVYSVSADGADLRRIAEGNLELSERIRAGSGPKRIVRHGYNPNAAPEMKEWILATATWGESYQTALVKISDNRLAAVGPDQPVDLDAECEKAVPSERRAGGLMNDCLALLEMRYTFEDRAIHDAGISRWSGYRPISEWYGVTVEDGRVRALDYGHAMPRGGTILPQIGELTELRTLDVLYNELTGEIPAELGGLSKLETLLIIGVGEGDSRISGRLPLELGNLSNLKELSLSGNDLEGGIPPELGDLSNLEQLWLGGNRLVGEIPAELGDLSKLEAIDLSGNELEGEIPAELVNLSKLEAMDLRGNELEGEIPAELGNLSNSERLDLSGNRLAGHIPPELGGMANLNLLNLSGNRLEGHIPRELANLRRLHTLELRNNRLEGTIPAEFGDIPSLHNVSLTGNRLTGCVPPKRRFSWTFYADLPPCE